jgi:hypothetical protein
VPSTLATLQTLEVLLIITVMRSIYSYTVRNIDSIHSNFLEITQL